MFQRVTMRFLSERQSHISAILEANSLPSSPMRVSALPVPGLSQSGKVGLAGLWPNTNTKPWTTKPQDQGGTTNYDKEARCQPELTLTSLIFLGDLEMLITRIANYPQNCCYFTSRHLICLRVVLKRNNFSGKVEALSGKKKV